MMKNLTKYMIYTTFQLSHTEKFEYTYIIDCCQVFATLCMYQVNLVKKHHEYYSDRLLGDKGIVYSRSLAEAWATTVTLIYLCLFCLTAQYEHYCSRTKPTVSDKVFLFENYACTYVYVSVYVCVCTCK